MAEKKLTPMMEQYMQVKSRYPDCLIFFRLGDFYEMFMKDAVIASRELELTLTTRDRGKPVEEQTPMCGVPYHAAESYIARLAEKGYKVVICEQMEDPATAQGLVERDVVRIVTPGTVLGGEGLKEDDNNFLCGLFADESWAGLAFVDFSTGQTHLLACRLPEETARFFSELESHHPREIVYSAAAHSRFREEMDWRFHCGHVLGDEEAFTMDRGREALLRQYSRQVEPLDASEGEAAALSALGGLLNYLYETQKTTHLDHLHVAHYFRPNSFMELDRVTRRNLELTETLWTKERRGSLLWAMDRCKSAMGRRMLRRWLERPLKNDFAVNHRQSGVAELYEATALRASLRQVVGQTVDLERVMSRLSCSGGSARELLALADGLEPVVELMTLLEQCKAPVLRELLHDLDPMTDLKTELRRAIKTGDLPTAVTDGGFIAAGYDGEVDRCSNLLENGGRAVLDIESREKERTGIKTLKIKYNKVFGYFIEVSNSYKSMVPDDYIRKQTLTNGERYITQELKQLEEDILTAREQIAKREYALFCQLRRAALDGADAIARTAKAIASADVLAGLAQLAVEQNYCRPTVDHSGRLFIRDGRHPVLEQTLTDGVFVPNDTNMDGVFSTVNLITGPNMAGKSTYMRQVGLMTIMAQIGSFVPAAEAHIAVCDRVFTRIGASDDLNAGQSTFMVEMMEVAEILKSATRDSLILLDEVGRGTSTYDGLAIARAVVEYCALEIRAKTIFATHYHELIDVVAALPGSFNYHAAAEKKGRSVAFLRKILPGGVDQSYGIEVAALAGVPNYVLSRARAELKRIESHAPAASRPRPEMTPYGVRYPGMQEMLWQAQVRQEVRAQVQEEVLSLAAAPAADLTAEGGEA